jgi:4-aminobutyrate aminotransferase
MAVERVLIMGAAGRAFHGRTFGALSLTNSSSRYRSRYRPLLPEVYHAPFPYCFRCPMQKSHPACKTACADYLEQVIFRHLIAPEVAGRRRGFRKDKK